MKTTIDQAGRLVIPRDIRREAGLRPRMPLDIRLREGRIEIEPAPVPVTLVRKGKLLIAIPQTGVVTLTADTVERAGARTGRWSTDSPRLRSPGAGPMTRSSPSALGADGIWLS